MRDTKRIKQLLALCMSIVAIFTTENLKAQPISRVDESGNLLVYEQDFLPFGFYCEALAFDENPNLAEQIASGGFNYIYAESYGKPPDEIEAYLNDYSDFLNDCETHNVKVVNGLLWYLGSPELFTTYVNALKVHPALICWNLMDDANGQGIEIVAQQKEEIIALDSSRVTSISFYSNEPDAAYMLPLTELSYMQSYPWELDSDKFDLSHTDFLYRNQVLACKNENVVPIATPQTFAWEYETYPSPLHVDCQTYLAFITGIKGILYYTFKDYDNNSTIDITQPEVFEAASNVANEILQTEWKDVILHGEHQYTNAGQYQYYATWRYNNGFYLVAVNASHDNSYFYEIPLPEDVTGEAINYFDYRPNSLSVQNQMLSGELEPYQVSIYKMETISGFSHHDKARNIRVFPNPTEKAFYISGIKAPYQMQIYNALGACVIDKKIYDDADKISLGNMNSGIYVVKVRKDGIHKYNAVKIFKK